MNSQDNASADSRTPGAAGLKETLTRDGKQRVERGKRTAAERMEDIADALDVAGSHLDQSQPTLASYASRCADGVATMAKRLREESIEDLTRDARDLAIRKPAAFLLGSAALGLIAARFLRVSSQGNTTSGAAEGLSHGHDH
ncbi:MAG TPA: hypothetical protein VGN07_15895 [Steroidobacteraceae bacterium]|jgi:hypothetical protein